MANGRSEVIRVDAAPGHPSKELTWDEIRLKFMDCAAHGLIDPARAERAFDAIAGLDKCADVSAVVDLLTMN
jgi:hypothetical protein